LRKAQAISSADVAASLSPSSSGWPRRQPRPRQHVDLFQHLDDRPVGDPLAVGEAAAADDRRVDRRHELGGEPGLADAGITENRDQLATALDPHTLPRFPHERELPLTSDEQRPVPSLRHVAHVQQPVGRNRLCLALQHQRLDRLHLGRLPDERERWLPEQHLARLGGLLQPRRHVDRITRREALLRPRHHLTRHHTDPPFEPQPGQRVAHLQRRPQRPQRVILVHQRHPEHRHHRVTDELLHAAAVPLHDRPHPFEVTRKQPTQPLGIERLAEGGRTGQVAEQNRYRLALLLRPPG